MGNQGDVKRWEVGKKAEYGRDIRQPADNINLDEERAVPSQGQCYGPSSRNPILQILPEASHQDWCP